jgi:hypothetical protein
MYAIPDSTPQRETSCDTSFVMSKTDRVGSAAAIE